MRNVARSFGIPPWQMEHPERPPTPWEATAWFLREERLRRLGL